MMKRCCIALLAHVDAGKTTLSEGILYECGVIRNPGRVDKKDSFLDNYTLERARGITIFSKQAVFNYKGTGFTLLDTPGHADFSAEAERTLPVLDAAVLVISGPEGIQAHTRTLWRLLAAVNVPVFIFVNKCDREVDKIAILNSIKKELSAAAIDMTGMFHNDNERVDILENIATCDGDVLDEYLNSGDIAFESVGRLIEERKCFPVVFGSALKLDGIVELLDLLEKFAPGTKGSEKDTFSAKVFKIGRDKSGNRLSYMKITSGVLKARDEIRYLPRPSLTGDTESDGNDQPFDNMISEKVTQLRIYSADRYEAVETAESGMCVAGLGLSATYAGQLLGSEKGSYVPELVPVMEYRVVENDRSRLLSILKALKQLEEEEPSLAVYWSDELKELRVRIMGEIQLDILKFQLMDRFGLEVVFDTGSVLYKETVSKAVIGVGHFEPLRHYAEVQLLIEPGERGSGITVSSMVSVNDLALNWQRLIITHILEKEHKGVLTGAALTDVQITIVAGRAHLKHTEGGDFRQSTYRAIRQGLMKAGTRLLEPYLEFTLTVPTVNSGRAMTDIDRMFGKITSREDKPSGDVILCGIAPAATISGYVRDVTAYTKGLGSISLSYAGYYPCHNEAEVVEASKYDPEQDLRNPSSSVFCAHGAGFLVPWNEVDAYKHIDCKMDIDEEGIINISTPQENFENATAVRSFSDSPEMYIGTDEIDAIIERTAYGNRRAGIKNPYKKIRKLNKPDIYDKTAKAEVHSETKYTDKKDNAVSFKDRYLLVDGYNIIFSWDELKILAAENLDGAREKLNDILSNYQAMTGFELIVVYDAYRVEGHREEYYIRHNIKVVFTRQAETADRYIERFSHENAAKYDITVATSDGLEQVIIRGAGCRLMTSSDLKEAIKHDSKELSERFLSSPSARGALIGEMVDLPHN